MHACGGPDNNNCNRCNLLIKSDLVVRELLDASRSLGESTSTASISASGSAPATATHVTSEAASAPAALATVVGKMW